MGDEHLWWVPDCSGGNISRGVVEKPMLVMGIDADRVDGMLLWTKTLASAG